MALLSPMILKAMAYSKRYNLYKISGPINCVSAADDAISIQLFSDGSHESYVHK